MADKKIKVIKESGPTQLLVEISREVVLWPEFDQGVSVEHDENDILALRVVARGKAQENFRLRFDNAVPPEHEGLIDANGIYEFEGDIKINNKN